MHTFLTGRSAIVDVALASAEGAPLAASACTWRLLDEKGAELIAATPITPWSTLATCAQIPVPGATNALGAGVSRGLRQIELTLTTEAGVVLLVEPYALTRGVDLVVPAEAFTSYGEAMLAALTIPDVVGWGAASQAERLAALMQARRHIATIDFRFELSDGLSRIDPRFYGTLADLDAIAFAQLPAQFLEALRIASVLEADDLMRDEAHHWREAGVLSKSTGESKMMFRPGTPTRRAVCARAWRALSPFMSGAAPRIGRA